MTLPWSGQTRFSKRQAGIEPAHPPWHGGRQPLHHWRIGSVIREKESNLRVLASKANRLAIGSLSTPPRNRTSSNCFEDSRASITPAGRIFLAGPEGLEPSPAWLRARYAAANTSVPKYLVRQFVSNVCLVS